MISAAKGTRDILPAESARWRYVENRFADVCERFAFHEIRIPTFEATELFQRGVGDTTDIVQKEMYTFEDKGGRSLTLRPEGTAGVVRSYLEQGLASLPTPLRLYYIISAFRYEKMQKGRYREFHQLGCELFGTASPLADVEVVSLLWTFLQSLGLKDLALRINSIGCPTCRKAYYDKLRAALADLLPNLCETCQGRYQKNPLRILDCKEEKCQHQLGTKDLPQLIDHLCPDCQAHHQAFKAGLDALGIPYVEDSKIVRGLDYYSRSVFEFVSEHIGSQGALCGGGRYDRLVSDMGGPETPAVGFALGLERLLLEMEHQQVYLPEQSRPELYLAAFPEQRLAALKLAQELRAAGLRVDVDICERSFKAQLKNANKSGALALAVLGETELAASRLQLKRMADGVEVEAAFNEIAVVLEGWSKAAAAVEEQH